jgi:hypothetical protein
MDDYVLESLQWDAYKKKECERAYNFCVQTLHITMTEDEFSSIWYSEDSDKSGKSHLANMCMSIFQSRKSVVGKHFEDLINLKHKELNILYYQQVWIDSDGTLCTKKPTKSCHKIDCLIPPNSTTMTINDMYLISKKTTLRERYRQDLDFVGKCKGVIFLTKEIPDKTKIQTILGYGCIVVYPHAPDTEKVWSYEKYFSEIKKFQNL